MSKINVTESCMGLLEHFDSCLLMLIIVTGCGPVGLLAIGIAKVMGATKV